MTSGGVVSAFLSAVRRVFVPQAADSALDDRWYAPAYGRGGATYAGVNVTPETSKRVSTVFRCISLLANALATLPFGVFERLERGRREVIDHKAYRTFAIRSNPYQSPLVFKRMMMGHLVLRGNCFARIVESGGELELWPLHPDRVSGPVLLPDGRLRYGYTRPDNGREERYIGGIDIWHLTGLSDDGLRGLSLADLARDTFGLAMATEQHGAKLFSKGMRLAGALKTDKTMGQEAKTALSKAFREDHADWGLPVLEDGLEFVSMGITPEDAQSLETRKFEVSDIARWFGIPPHMVGDVERSTSWGTGIENQTIQFVTDGLLPWVQLWEESIDGTFIPEPDLYSKFNVNARLRADSKTRSEIARTYVEIGVWSPNDVREMEDENPREGGDVYVTPRSPNEPAPRGGGSDGPSDGPPPPMAPPMAPDDEEAAGNGGRVIQLARSVAESFVTEETEALTKLAKEHSKDDAAWRRSVQSHFGRLAARLDEGTMCGAPAARSYCDARRDVILAGGIKACLETRDRAVELLVGLIMVAFEGGKDASA